MLIDSLKVINSFKNIFLGLLCLFMVGYSGYRLSLSPDKDPVVNFLQHFIKTKVTQHKVKNNVIKTLAASSISENDIAAQEQDDQSSCCWVSEFCD